MKRKSWDFRAKEKVANLECSYTKEKLETLREADEEYWEALDFQSIFSNIHLVDTYTETFFNLKNWNREGYIALPPSLLKPQKENKKFISLAKFWENKDNFAQYIDSLINELRNSSREDDPEYFNCLLSKRYFLMQQKYLSNERTTLRKTLVNTPIAEANLTRPLELFLDIMAPMLNAHAEIPLHISVSSLKSISINKFDINNAIQKLHENFLTITRTYPKRFIQSVRDWVQGLLNDILITPEDDQQKFKIISKKQCIEFCALALLNFGIETSSISCLLAAINCLEFQCEKKLTQTQDFEVALKNLYTIANSQPDTVHTISYFPVVKSDSAKGSI